MAPNGASSRKTPAAPPKAAKNEHGGDVALGSLFDALEDYGSPKVKREIEEGLPVIKKRGNWDSEVTNGENQKSTNERSTALMKKVPSSLAKAFRNNQPMSDAPAVLKCNHCKRPVLEHAMPRHIESCLNKRQEKQRKKKEAKEARDAAARKEKGLDDSEEEDDVASKTAIKTGAGKKRKAIDEGDDGGPNKKKKKKDEPKAKAGKPKAPVDVERQCGVDLPQGGQCARSLTCKSHSMGAKRAVRRSAPYDKLLMEYQRKNQAKLQKAAMDANAPDPEDDTLPSGPIDEDEEKDAVMASLASAWGGQPLYQRPMVPLRRKYEFNRVKGMLASALGGRNGGGLFGTTAGSGGVSSLFGGTSRDATLDDGLLNSRRGSVVPAARSMAAPAASRKPSIASAVGA